MCPMSLILPDKKIAVILIYIIVIDAEITEMGIWDSETHNLCFQSFKKILGL